MNWIRWVCWVVLAGISSWAHAVIGPVSVSASSNMVLLSEGARASVNWTTTFTATVGPAVVSSPQINFRTLSGALITSQSRIVSRTLASSGSSVFTESVHVPAAVANAAYRMGSAGVRIERVFTDSTDSGAPQTGTHDLYLGSSPAAGLMVSRIDLVFAQDGRTKLVARDSVLKAIARLRTEGNGWLDARWEIADGSGLDGAVLYRPLRAVRQFVGGGQVLELESPPLPTTGTGRYLVRLQVREPQGAADASPLLYQVMARTETDSLGLLEPADATLLSPTTRFAWLPVPGARAYVLELVPENGQPGPAEPRGAVMVPSGSTEVTLSTLVRQGLESAARYGWRVVALDANGETLTRSPLRHLQLP